MVYGTPDHEPVTVPDSDSPSLDPSISTGWPPAKVNWPPMGRGVGPPTLELLGRYRVPSTTANTTTAAVAAIGTRNFIGWDLHDDHPGRRWGVEGSSAITASRTRSGSAVEPPSSQDRTMRVEVRSEFIGQPPEPPAA